MTHRRTASLFAGLALLFSLVFASPVAAINPDPCTGNADASFGWTWERKTNIVGVAFKGVRGAFVARALEPCTGAGNFGKAFALVTFQGFVGTVDTVYHFGLMKDNLTNQTFFGWTVGNSSSTPVVRATWVDFNGDGTADNPQGGRTYTFRIFRYNGSDPGNSFFNARFCVDSSDPAEGTVCKSVNYNNGYSGSASWTGTAWWGCEAGPNGTSNVGSGNGTTNRLYMQNAAYLRATDNAWVYTQNSPLSNNTPLWITPPSNQYVAQDDNGYLSGDRVWCWGT